MSLSSGGTARTGSGGAQRGTEDDPAYHRGQRLFRLVCVVSPPTAPHQRCQCWLSRKDTWGGLRGEGPCGGLAALVGLRAAGMFWQQERSYQCTPAETRPYTHVPSLRSAGGQAGVPHKTLEESPERLSPGINPPPVLYPDARAQVLSEAEAGLWRGTERLPFLLSAKASLAKSPGRRCCTGNMKTQTTDSLRSFPYTCSNKTAFQPLLMTSTR